MSSICMHVFTIIGLIAGILAFALFPVNFTSFKYKEDSNVSLLFRPTTDRESKDRESGKSLCEPRSCLSKCR